MLTAEQPDWRVIDAWPYGPVHVLEALWQRLGLAAIIRQRARGSRLGFDVERALFAMVANRSLAPRSKLYCWQPWLREDVWIAGTQALKLQQLYRAMDFLEANREELEQEVFFRVSDLFNVEVDLILYDSSQSRVSRQPGDALVRVGPRLQLARTESGQGPSVWTESARSSESPGGGQGWGLISCSLPPLRHRTIARSDKSAPVNRVGVESRAPAGGQIGEGSLSNGGRDCQPSTQPRLVEFPHP